MGDLQVEFETKCFIMLLNSTRSPYHALQNAFEPPMRFFESGRVLVTRRLRITLRGCMATCAMSPTVFVSHVSVERRVVWSLAWLAMMIPLAGIAVVVVRRCGHRHGLLHLLKQFQNFQLNRIALYRVDLWLYWCCYRADV